ncbi:MAG: Rpn family recombination-promoting nuclease/putative transposase [Saccharospirillaceae bacterium]|nr:Rpn family recombination-promoting nuclease/putative transposase [Saccharospirillaceae bacterium]
MKFLDVRTDFAFKKVFGSKDSKPRLISFLNAIIDFDDRCEITDLVIVDPYNIPQLKGMKDTFVDVKAQLNDGTSVIVEMQVLNHPGLENRILYNAAKNYSAQLVKGERYNLLKPVIALTIVAFDMFVKNDQMINYYKLLNKHDFTDYNNDIELIFVELNKFTKTQEQCDGIQDDWIYFLKNAGDLSMIPKNINKTITTAYEISNEAGMTREELEIQYNKKQYIAIQNGSITLAKQRFEQGFAQGFKQGFAQGFKQGFAQGFKQGFAQGIEQEKLDNAKKMLEEGIDILLVTRITGLTEKQIKNEL